MYFLLKALGNLSFCITSILLFYLLIVWPVEVKIGIIPIAIYAQLARSYENILKLQVECFLSKNKMQPYTCIQMLHFYNAINNLISSNAK